jgi:NitT/TauT family transport system permease protein
MTLLNAIPRVILAPLFVIWLGIGMASKVALAFILVAVLMFFTVSRSVADAGHWCATCICRRWRLGYWVV